MSFATLKTQIQAQITDKELVPNSVGATEVGTNMDDIIDEVIAAFAALNGGVLPTDQDTLYKIANKIIAINALLGTSGKTIDQIIIDLNARDTSSAVDTKISTAINALVAGSPGLLDTLDELAQALGDDPNFATTMTGLIAAKEPSFSKNTGFNKNFGTTAGTVSEGNHTHNTDTLTEGSTKKFFSDALTRAVVMTGLVNVTGIMDAADSVLVLFGKIKKTLADIATSLGNKANLSGGTVPLGEMDARVALKDAVTGKLPLEDIEYENLEDKLNPLQTYVYDTGVLDGEGAPILKVGIDQPGDSFILLQDLGIAIKGETLLVKYHETSGSNMTKNQIRFSWIKANREETITQLLVHIRALGVFTTPTGFNGVGLYKVLNIVTGEASLVAQSANDADIWRTGLGIKRIPTLTPYLMGPGLYLLAVRYDSTDAAAPVPNLLSRSWDGGGNGNLFEGVKLGFAVNATDLPATVNIYTGTNNIASNYWGGYN